MTAGQRTRQSPVTPTLKRAVALSRLMAKPGMAETNTVAAVVWAARVGSA